MNLRIGSIMAMFLSLLILPTFEAEASHVVGGQLTYNMVGFERVEFTLIVRRDCELGDPEADYDDPAYLAVFDFNMQPVTNPIYGFFNGRIEISLNPADTLDESLQSGCEVLLDGVCVQEATYRLTRNIQPHPSGGYIIAYQRCCRNGSLTNVLDPLNTGMTLVSVISNEAIQTQNKSAALPDFPPIYSCMNLEANWDQGATDADGDELRYRLNTPNIGATNADPYPANASAPPYDPITWAGGYSQANMLNTPTPLTIDPSTGVISVEPDAIGQFLVNYCVEEIRDNRVFNTTCREFEVNVRPCGDPALAVIDGVPDLQCDDLDVTFSSAGSVGDSIAWVICGDTIINPADPFTHTFADTGMCAYQVWVTNTMSGCYDVDSAVITLYNSGVEADFNITMLTCVDTLDVLVEDNSTYDTLNPPIEKLWDVTVGGATIATDTGSTLEFVLTDNVVATICLYITVENGCMVTECQTVNLNALDLIFDSDEILCLDEESMITVEHAAGDDITVTWEPNDIIIDIDTAVDGREITVYTADSIVTTLYFTATNEFGCSVSDSINITTAGERPDLSFIVSQEECGSLTIDLVNTSIDSVPIIWDFGDGTTDTIWEPSHTYANAGTYTITLSGGMVPCTTVVSMTVEVPINDVIDLADTSYQCFNDSLTLNPGGNTDWEYNWSPIDLFSDPTAASPTILVDTTTTVYVTIRVFNGDNYCDHMDTITVVPVPDFQFDLSPDPTEDITICGGSDSTVLLTATADSGVVVTWKDINGTVLAVGDSFNLDLEDGLNQIVVMGVYNGIEECMKSETYNITLNRIELSFDITNLADGTDMFCMPDTGLLVVTVDGPPGNYTYEWSPNYNVISGLDNDSLLLFVDSSVTYCVTVTNTDLNCSETGCYTINFGADVVVTLLDGDGVICAGDTVKLVAEISPQGSDCSYNWDVTGDIIGPDDQDTLCYVASSTHTAQVSVGCVGGCSDMASIQVEVRDLSALISISAVDIPVETDGQVVQLDVINGEIDWTYLWEGPEISDPTIKNPTSEPGRGEHVYSVMVIDEFGCEGEATLNTGPPPPVPCEHPYVFIPNAFSPNGDGNNETLDVYGVEIDEIELLLIYNRWGQEVFRVQNQPTASWDGVFEGDLLESDVFGYYLRVLCLNGERSEQQGNITLLR